MIYKGYFEILAGTEVLAVSGDYGIANSLYHGYKYDKKFRYPDLVRFVYIEKGRVVPLVNINEMTKKEYQDYKWCAMKYGWSF